MASGYDDAPDVLDIPATTSERMNSIASLIELQLDPETDVEIHIDNDVALEMVILIREFATELAATVDILKEPRPIDMSAVPNPIAHVLQFFSYGHLSPKEAVVSKQFYDLAHLLVGAVPFNPELTVALRKLLEAKDAAVRASFAK